MAAGKVFLIICVILCILPEVLVVCNCQRFTGIYPSPDRKAYGSVNPNPSSPGPGCLLRADGRCRGPP
uniref:Uncharacterized protein n=1 Tax=Vitis vinifera TaxID=29760 RepID=F6HFQ7_VITVI